MPDYAIYEIRNDQTGKIYVGSSKSTRQRFAQHRRQLRQGVHHNRYLQRAWAKQKGQGFQFVVVDHCTVDERWDREECHFKRFPRQQLYNLTLVARGGTRTGQKNSPEHRARISAGNKGKHFDRLGQSHNWGRKIGDAHIRNMSFRVRAEHLDGRVLMFDSVRLAAGGTGLKRKSVSNILNGWKGQTRTRTGWAFTKIPKEG